jgi:hypothetical protein
MAVIYEITVEGHLDGRWSSWFEGMTLAYVETGRGATILTGEMKDQSALHGVFIKVRDLGLTIVSVRRIEVKPRQDPAQPL